MASTQNVGTPWGSWSMLHEEKSDSEFSNGRGSRQSKKIGINNPLSFVQLAGFAEAKIVHKIVRNIAIPVIAGAGAGLAGGVVAGVVTGSHKNQPYHPEVVMIHKYGKGKHGHL